MHRGYVALWRRFQKHPFWKEPREFSKAEAWIDILWEAQHELEPKEVILGMNVFTCHYGECLKSVKTWSERWMWSRSKVFRFLKLLKKLKQINFKSETVTTRIIVKNYEIYDPKRNANETEVKRKWNASEHQSNTDNNDKKIDNTKVLSGNTPKKKPAQKKKPAPQAPPANNHFSFKVGDQVEKIKRHCRDIEKHPQANVFNPWQWVTQKTQIRGHPLAISGSLEWLLVCLNGEEPVENPYGLVEKTFKTKNPKFNERQEIEDSKAFKSNKADAKEEFNKLWAKIC